MSNFYWMPMKTATIMALQGWGWNGHGQLGDGTMTTRLTPTPIGTDAWKMIATGSNHSLGIRADGRLFSWGLNTSGQLGDGTTTRRLTPTPIGTDTWRMIAAGWRHSLGMQ